MKNARDKERFIELRAEGRSYADIAVALNVSKPTLIVWGKVLQREVANARTLRLDALFERFAVAKAKRIEVFGKRLEAIMTELDTRDLADVKTDVLLKLAMDYGSLLKGETIPLTMQGEDIDFDVSALTTRDTWPV
ncbi:MAG: hypothetical protein WAO55_01170 [Candidatus Manganitrophaceae bacterium]